MIRFACLVATTLVLLVTSADQANAQAPLFSQYTTQGAGSPSAAAYPAPHWSPILGGESYYTYQPLMPHEMMYQHSRNYYNYYDGGYYGGGQGLIKTSVRWQAGTAHMGPLPFSTGVSGLLYRAKSRRYNIPGGNSVGGGLGSGLGSGIGGQGGCLRGKCGCLNGSCRAKKAFSSDAILGDPIDGGIIDGEIISGGCAGGCTADAATTIQR